MRKTPTGGSSCGVHPLDMSLGRESEFGVVFERLSGNPVALSDDECLLRGSFLRSIRRRKQEGAGEW